MFSFMELKDSIVLAGVPGAGWYLSKRMNAYDIFQILTGVSYIFNLALYGSNPLNIFVISSATSIFYAACGIMKLRSYNEEGLENIL